MIGSGLLLASAWAAPAPAAPDFDVVIDRRILAVTITMWLASEESDDWMSSLPAYRAALRAHFGPHRDHRAVQLAGQLARAGFTFDAPVGWALHLDPHSWAPRTGIPAYYTSRAGSSERLEAYRLALLEFAREADLDGFVQAMAPLHSTEIARVRRSLAAGALDDLERFYGDPADASYALVVVPSLGPHHHGVTVETRDGVERYQVSNTLRWLSDAELQQGLENLLLHEFGHPLAKPVIAAAGDRAQRLGDTMMAPIEASMRDQAYPTWSLAFEEHLVRAATCRLLQQRHGEDVAQMCLAAEVARGFRYIVPLYDALGDYRSQRARYPRLTSYARTLVRALEPVARDPGGWWAASAWSSPPTLAPRQATVVLPTGPGATPELQQAARALAMRRHGNRLVTDREALTLPNASYVVVGNAQANQLASRYAPDQPLLVEPDGIQVGAARFNGTSIGLVATISGPGGQPWQMITGTDATITALLAAQVNRDAGWQAVSARGAACGTGHLPPAVRLAPTPRELPCDPEPVQRPWVPHPLGEPLRWTARVPIELSPQRFEAVVAETVAACQPEAEVVGIDCHEPPCIVRLRSKGAAPEATIVRCEPWEIPYGPTVHLLRASVPCPDGPDERVVLLAPTPPPLQRALGEQPLADRLGYRWMGLLGSWTCASTPTASDADLR